MLHESDDIGPKTVLKGKIVLLSDASGGIGSEIARYFDREGSRLICTCLDDDRGKIEIKQRKETLKGDYITIVADLTIEKEVDKIFNEGFSGIYVSTERTTRQSCI